ncbi:LCP family protein required for cell wall assembly [Streptomyces canus]|uniref:LCP family protein required for cell wall assembly n=1 Tax=Streptomyces canus TaxID=58343 RepID=A0AAW8FH14_9ACTN|nr:LCP family protein [Streptomyces canus]MDQ0909437.1 LCP family protein required for cell wall assembly [Streptomyces canus]
MTQPLRSRRHATGRIRAEKADPAELVGGGRAAMRRASKKPDRRRALKIVGLLLGFVLVLGVGTAAYAYWKLNSNIKSDHLSANGKDGAGHEKVDAFGRSPINILVIGSDARNSAADCKLGGACGTAGGARADVEMIVHISADRSNATVMSIPRDLRTDWSGCHDPGHPSMPAQTRAQVNSALNGGPGCSVVAVHQLTGIPIDHFMMIDFAGVVAMSNAVGGTRVCVSKNVYDPYSHLKLKEGSHTLKGDAALEFVRTRHGFGDSSDSRGRTDAQHIFLNALLNQMKSKGTLSSPSKMWGIANAATKALTVDNSLDSANKLIDLALDLNKVPASRITWATMQTQDVDLPGGGSETLIGPGAKEMFKTIADDQSLTASTGKKGSPSATASPVSAASVAVHVENGTGVYHRGVAIAQALIDQGFSKETDSGNGTPSTATSLTYPAGQKAQAQAVAKALGLPSKAVEQGTGSQIVLLIGTDWTTGDTFPGGKPTPTHVDTQVALNGSHQQTGDTKKCATVSPYNDVIGLDANGMPTSEDHPPSSTSPTEAYALAKNVKDSAP